ncbi:MAG: hypothetical protein ACREND_12080 [Gemmatimonadaceae bacterium]
MSDAVDSTKEPAHFELERTNLDQQPVAIVGRLIGEGRSTTSERSSAVRIFALHGDGPKYALHFEATVTDSRGRIARDAFVHLADDPASLFHLLLSGEQISVDDTVLSAWRQAKVAHPPIQQWLDWCQRLRSERAEQEAVETRAFEVEQARKAAAVSDRQRRYAAGVDYWRTA